MATKPTVRIPNWASAGTKTDPGGSKEATGWVVSERPPASWFNWIYNAFGQWLDYFEEVTDVGIMAYGRVSVNLSTGAVSLGTNTFNLHSGITGETNRLVVIIDVPMLNGWVGIATTPSGATAPLARIVNVTNSGGSVGLGPAGTRDLVIDVFSHDGTAIDIDGGGSGTIYFDVVAIGTT
jgi:hypothetical protein